MQPSRPNASARWLEVWARRGVAARILYPFSVAFALAARLRRLCYRWRLLPRERLPVAVVVVGNITVGGAGKTPLVIYLAQELRRRGRSPGIVSRGYRGYAGAADRPLAVNAQSDPGVVGDEPVLLARRSGCPVVVGRDRVAAARALLAAYPHCDTILSDDGLQHYRLERDCELAVFDRRGAMNGWLLPAGPLREPLARLNEVDAVVLNAESWPAVPPAPTFAVPLFRMRLQGAQFYRLGQPDVVCCAADLAGLRLHAVAGIGAPQRFFAQLSDLGLSVEPHSFPDHHAYGAAELDFVGDALLTTEKDAVKLQALHVSLPVWVLPVAAELTPSLADFVLEKLDGRSSA